MRFLYRSLDVRRTGELLLVVTLTSNNTCYYSKEDSCNIKFRVHLCLSSTLIWFNFSYDTHFYDHFCPKHCVLSDA